MRMEIRGHLLMTHVDPNLYGFVFLLWNTKRDILMNAHAALFHTSSLNQTPNLLLTECK